MLTDIQMPPDEARYAMFRKARFRKARYVAAFVIAAAGLIAANRTEAAEQTSDQMGTALAKEFVSGHNKWRQRVGIDDVSWSGELARQAQEYADTLQNRGCIMEHSGTDDYGENLYLGWAKPGPVNVSPTEVVDSWGSEKQYYDYDSNSCNNPKESQGCGHYTQLVWSDTEEIGCGMASCNNKDNSETEIWVCQYTPPGNYIGEKPY